VNQTKYEEEFECYERGTMMGVEYSGAGDGARCSGSKKEINSDGHVEPESIDSGARKRRLSQR
jgi:hypothetical protein